MEIINNLRFTNGEALHDYLSSGLASRGIDFCDGDLFSDPSKYNIQPVDFDEAIKLNYLSIDDPEGHECYLYEPIKNID